MNAQPARPTDEGPQGDEHLERLPLQRNMERSENVESHCSTLFIVLSFLHIDHHEVPHHQVTPKLARSGKGRDLRCLPAGSVLLHNFGNSSAIFFSLCKGVS
jgi:hypothetical protein